MLSIGTVDIPFAIFFEWKLQDIGTYLATKLYFQALLILDVLDDPQSFAFGCSSERVTEFAAIRYQGTSIIPCIPCVYTYSPAFRLTTLLLALRRARNRAGDNERSSAGQYIGIYFNGQYSDLTILPL